MKTVDYRTAPCLALLALCVVAEGGEAPPQVQKVSFDINASSMVQALMQFAEQSQLQLMVPTEGASNVAAPKVVGNYTPVAALDQLLSGTRLKYEFANPHTVAIRTAEASAPSSSGEKSSASPSESSKSVASSPSERTAESPSPDTDTDRAGRKPDPSSDVAKRGISEILVRGSRTMNIDVVRSEDDVQPYTILDSKQIERSGATNVEEFLKQQLTMNTAAKTNSQSPTSFSGTTSSINLRGLGPNETLILIDGRRSAGVSIQGTTNQPDINGIPLSAIERIEVLPSSASAIYGGAAVGGVLNVVLKKDFEGGGISYTYDHPTDSGANQRTTSASYGRSFWDGRTQILVAGHYADGSPLRLGDREDLFERGVAEVLGNSPSVLYSPFIPFQGATPNVASATGAPLTLKSGGTALNAPITSIPVGAAPGTDLSAELMSNAGTYNLDLAPGSGSFGLKNIFGTVPRSKSLLATIRQSLFNDVQLFADFSAKSNAGRTYSNPFARQFAVSAAAPTNPFQQNVNVTFPSTIAAPFISDSVTRSATLGVVVPLGLEWSSELDYTWSRNSFEIAFFGIDARALRLALNAGTINPFVDTLAHPLTLDPYLTPQAYKGSATLNDLNFRASGPIGSLPGGRPVLTLGLEHRKEGSENASFTQEFPLTPASTLSVEYFGQPQSTASLYMEALVPLIGADNSVPAVHSLELQAAGRSERYTVRAGTALAYSAPASLVARNPPQGMSTEVQYTSTNPTIGIKYQPLADVAFRASYSTAFLPPTAAQLLPDPTPRCASSPCVAITDPDNGQTYNINYTIGGNPNLRPQTSKNWNFGVIWEPQQEALRGLRMNVEYYRIAQPDYITSPTVQQLVSDPSFAGLVTRDPSTGLISTVEQSPVNAIEYRASGWDFKINYRKATGFGDFGIDTAASLIKDDLRQYGLDSPFLDYAGYPNDGGVGKLKANAMLSWQRQRWTAAWNTTYHSSYYQQNAEGGPYFLQFGPNPYFTDAQGSQSIPSQIYHDLYSSYTFGDGNGGLRGALLSQVTVTFGIKNVFNTLPPFDASFQPYFYSPFGDVRLRTYRVSVSKAF